MRMHNKAWIPAVIVLVAVLVVVVQHSRKGSAPRRAPATGGVPVATPEPTVPAEVSASPIVAYLRKFMSAQKEYAAQNGGLFDEPPCLVKPSSCIPDYGKDRPSSFLDKDEASLSLRDGYALSFHPGMFVPPEEAKKNKVSPSSLKAFAIVAAPTQPGHAAFCADSRGFLCARLDGVVGRPWEGTCSPECVVLK
jgi:hypothetical protein